MNVFSETYTEARSKFLQACLQNGAWIQSDRIVGQLGPDGEALLVDFARFGPPDAKTALLCTSGTHGAEGYPGSAVQTDWINTYASAFVEANPDIAFYFIHAVNPYGFAWGLRNNENNVDLNRNWVDFNKPLPKNSDYDKLVDIVSLSKIRPDTEQIVLAELAPHLQQLGLAKIESVLTEGQYDHPKATAFGGAGPQFSRLALERFISEQMTSVQRVGFLDLHSGTVGLGDNIFLCFSPPKSKEFARAASWWGEENLDAKQVEEKWGGQRPARHGLMYWGIERAFGPSVAFTGAVIEFGTLTADQRMEALWSGLYERYLRFGDDVEGVDIIDLRARVKAAFDCTGDPAWEAAVIENGRKVIAEAIAGLKSWAAEIERR